MLNDDETNNTHIHNNNTYSDHNKNQHARFPAHDEIGTSRNPTKVQMFSIGHVDKRLGPEPVDSVLITPILKSCKNAQARLSCITEHMLAVKQAISMMPRHSCTWPKKWRDSRFHERQMRVSNAYSIGTLSTVCALHQSLVQA